MKLDSPIIENDDARPPPTFREHHEKADAFCEKCNEELRRRGFHVCEAHVNVDWFGVIRLWRHEMTNKVGPNGLPGVLNVECPLPNPWALPVPMSTAEILNEALRAADETAVVACARLKVLRLNFTAYGRAVSATIAVPGNDQSARKLRIAVA